VILVKFFTTFSFSYARSLLSENDLARVKVMQGQNIIKKLAMQITKKADGKMITITTQKINKPYEGYGS
jgi:hypothetical protein